MVGRIAFEYAGGSSDERDFSTRLYLLPFTQFRVAEPVRSSRMDGHRHGDGARHPKRNLAERIVAAQQPFQRRVGGLLDESTGPGPSPLKFQPLPRPTGDAARVVVTEFDTSLG